MLIYALYLTQFDIVIHHVTSLEVLTTSLQDLKNDLFLFTKIEHIFYSFVVSPVVFLKDLSFVNPLHLGVLDILQKHHQESALFEISNELSYRKPKNKLVSLEHHHFPFVNWLTSQETKEVMGNIDHDVWWRCMPWSHDLNNFVVVLIKRNHVYVPFVFLVLFRVVHILDELLWVLGHGETAIWSIAYHHFLLMLLTFVCSLLRRESFDQILGKDEGPHLKSSVENELISIDLFPVTGRRNEVIDEVLVKLLRNKLQNLERKKIVLESCVLVISDWPIQLPQECIEFARIVLAYIPEEIFENALIPGAWCIIFLENLLFDVGFECQSIDVHLQFWAFLEVLIAGLNDHLL